MNNRQRLMLILLLFAAASTVFLILAVPPLSTGYILAPSYAFESVSPRDAEDAEDATGAEDEEDARDVTTPPRESGALEGEGGAHGAFPAPTDVPDEVYPLRARLDTRVALLNAERHASLSIGDYAEMGDYIVASGGRDATYEPVVETETEVSVGAGDSLLLDTTGKPVTVIGAERIWSRGRRVLALADGGRRFADISAHIFAEDTSDERQEITVSEADVVQIQPQWRFGDAPLVAAAGLGSRTVLADALARIYVVDERGVLVRDEQLFGSSLSNISALAGDHSGTNLYIIGGVSPTHLYHVRVDEEDQLHVESSTELPTTMRSSPHVEVADDIVAVAYANTVSIYSAELELTGRRVLEGEIKDIGFLSGDRILYVRSRSSRNMQTPAGERLNAYYADDLSPMYRLDFDFPVYSITASRGGLVVGSEHGILLYEEGAE